MLKKNLSFLIFCFLIFIRAILTYLTPLVSDESYYLLWASHPDLSYVDHPGMVSWINYIFLHIFREPLLSIRIASLTLLIATIFYIYKTLILFLDNKDTIWKILILYLLIPYNYFIAITMQVEQPLLLFSAVCIYYFTKLLKTENKRFFYGLAIATGFGLLSKYTFILLPTFMFFFIFFNNKYRKLIFSFDFFVSFCLTLFLLLPLFIWNISHNYISFLFHIKRIGESSPFEYTLSFIFDQLLYFSPVALYYLIKSILQGKKSSQNNDIFLYLGAFIFLCFFTISIFTKTWGHWTAIMFIPFSIYIGLTLSKSLNKIILSLLVFNLILGILLLFTGPSVIPLHVTYQNNYKILGEITAIQKKYSYSLPIYADLHASVGQLYYYLKQIILFPEGEFKRTGIWGQSQFEIWNNTKIYKGTSILYFTNPTPEIISKLETYFNSIRVYQEPKLTLIEGYINKYRFILCSESKYTFEF